MYTAQRPIWWLDDLQTKDVRRTLLAQPGPEVSTTVSLNEGYRA